MVNDQLQVGMFLCDGRDHRHVIGSHQRHGDTGLFGFRPDPVHGAVGRPGGLVGLGEAEPESEHAGLLQPAVDLRFCLRLVHRNLPQDGKPVGVSFRRIQGQTVRVRVPTWRVNYGRIDAGLIHFAQQVIGQEIGDLPVARIGRDVPLPEVHLRVNDQHFLLPRGSLVGY